MQISELKNNEMSIVIELYETHKKDFYEPITIEEFCEQFCHRCDTCKRIIYIEDMCEECDCPKYENEFQEFDNNKEKILYGL